LSELQQTTLERFLAEQRGLVDQELEQFLPAADAYPPVIHQAMRYSVFAGGKRLRPILCLESGRLFGGDEKSLLYAACAFELIHTYSLIHDDLPALDNDDLRRGKPTCHRAFGEANAILAGDALLTLAFGALSRPGPPPSERKLRVVREIAHAIGTLGGMVGGQVIDLEAAGRAVDSPTLDYIHSAKTGSLIRVAVRAGAIYADAGEPDLGRVSTYGEKIGLAFQIVDDLLDVLGSREAMGKPVGRDGQHQKATFPALHGVEESQRIASKLIREACDALEPYGSRAEKLQGIADFLLVRTS
jgi:geranylgeranyl diphosphate synthase, type II